MMNKCNAFFINQKIFAQLKILLKVYWDNLDYSFFNYCLGTAEMTDTETEKTTIGEEVDLPVIETGGEADPPEGRDQDRGPGIGV